MPRYELIEGTSAKFWEITRSKDKKAYTVRWGRIGTEGQKKTKKFRFDFQCTNEVNKLIDQKISKGYGVVDKATTKVPPKSATTSNPELEAAVHEAIDDRDRWLVYADWLQQVGDVRGEIIALHAAKKKAAANKLIEKNVDALWGNAAHLRAAEPFAGITWLPGWKKAKRMPLDVSLVLGMGPYGFVDNIDITGLDEEGHVAKALGALLSAPIGRFVKNISLGLDERYSGSSGMPNWGAVIGAIARAKPAGLRSFNMTAGGYQLSWTQTGDLGPLWKAAPHLESISIEIGDIDLGKSIDLPKLKRLRLETGGLRRKNLKAIANATWPSLEELVIFLGRTDYGGDAKRADIAALLSTSFPKLASLALCNSDIQGDVVREIVKSPLLRQLKSLDVSRGTMIDAEAQVLVESLASLKKLERLDVSENYLSPAMEKTLKKALGKAYAGGSRYDEMESERAEYGNEEWAKDATFRYTAVGE